MSNDEITKPAWEVTREFAESLKSRMVQALKMAEEAVTVEEFDAFTVRASLFKARSEAAFAKAARQWIQAAG